VGGEGGQVSELKRDGREGELKEDAHHALWVQTTTTEEHRSHRRWLKTPAAGAEVEDGLVRPEQLRLFEGDKDAAEIKAVPSPSSARRTAARDGVAVGDFCPAVVN
jgi:hypothetical protein